MIRNNSILEAIRNEKGQIEDFKITLVNKELERGTERTDLIGKHYVKEYPRFKSVSIFDVIVKTIQTGIPQQMEYYCEHEGFKQWFACMFVKLDDGVVATNIDITSRELAEQKLRTLGED